MAKQNEIEVVPKGKSAGHARRRLLSHVLSMLTSNVVHKGSMFLVYILVARFLSVEAFGQLALASALLFTWQRVCLMGLQTYLTREVARRPDQSADYLLHASTIGIAGSIVGLIALCPFLYFMQYEGETLRVILILFAALPVLVLSQICEGIFQGHERMDVAALVNVPVCLVRVLAVCVIIWCQGNIQQIAWSLTCLQFLYLAGLLIGLALCEVRIEFVWPQKSSCAKMFHESSVFLGIHTAIAIQASTVVTILSRLEGESAVGIYVAASQLLVPLALLFHSISMSLFPAMVRESQESTQQLSVMLKRTIELLMVVGMPSTLGLFILAPDLLQFVYRDPEFGPASTILQLLVWTLLTQVVTSVLGQALWAKSREKSALRIAVFNTISLLFLSFALTSLFGLRGAGLATLVSSLLNLGLHVILAKELLPISALVASLYRPLAATIVMTTWLVLQRTSGLVVLIGTSILVYGLALIVLGFCTTDWARQIWKGSWRMRTH